MVRVEQVGLQCYTIRDHCKTEADFTESMAKAAKIGARPAAFGEPWLFSRSPRRRRRRC